MMKEKDNNSEENGQNAKALKVFEKNIKRDAAFAVIIAEQFGLSKEKLTRAAIKVFEHALSECEYKVAIYIAEKYELGKDEQREAANKSYEYLTSGILRKGILRKYSDAIYIAEKYELGREKVLWAANKLYKRDMLIGEYGFAEITAKEYELGKEKEQKAALLSVQQYYRKLGLLKSIEQRLNILLRRERNP